MSGKRHFHTFEEYKASRNYDHEAVARNLEKMTAELRAYRLKELRQGLRITQVELAQLLHVSQNRISKLEQGDIGKSQVDTLRKYVEAMGGTLRIDVEVDGKTFQLA